MTRYARQISVSSFGTTSQALLSDASVLVVGAGGLGAPVLSYLVGAGIGRLRLIDGDCVSLSNLHRQTLFTEIDIGKSKATAAAERLSYLNSDIIIEPFAEALTPETLPEHAAGCSVLVDCADNFAVSYMMSDFSRLNQFAFVSASVVENSGYSAGFCAGKPSLRALFPDLPERLTSCLADGVIGPVVGVVGSLQAQMVVDILIGTEPPPLGQLVQFDSTGYRFGSFRFDNAPEPEKYFPFIGKDMLVPSDKVIDLRSADEAPVIIETAERLALEQLDAASVSAHQDRLVFCCQSGFRAWKAAERCFSHRADNIALIAVGSPNDRTDIDS